MVRRSARVTTLVPLAALAVLLALSSCGKKNVVTGPDGLEGVASSSQLIVYPDLAVKVYVFDDVKGNGCTDDDTLVTATDSYAVGAGAVRGSIYDFTPADQFQAFRNDGATFRPLQDYALQPAHRYVEGGTDLFRFDDRRAPGGLKSYVARGIENGAVSPLSPKTNVGTVTAPLAGTLRFAVHVNICGDVAGPGEAHPDSLPQLAWDPVPGAAGYWLHMFEFSRGADYRSSVYPTPTFLGRSVDHLVAYFPSTVTAYKVGDPVPAGARIVAFKNMLNNSDYAVRITAVNAGGQMIAYSGSTSRAYFYRRLAGTQYEMVPFGSFVLHTGSPTTCPAGCPQPVSTGVPGVKVFSPDALPPQLR